MLQSEWDVRIELAACYRLFVRYGWTDLIFTHLSARVLEGPRTYLINPYGLLFEEVTASNLIKVDFAGNLRAGEYTRMTTRATPSTRSSSKHPRR